ERLVAVASGYERAVGALVDQQELAAIELDARVQAGDEVALDHHVVLLGPADRDFRPVLIEHDLAARAARHQVRRAVLFTLAAADRYGGQHAGGVFLLPQHFVELIFAGLALGRRHVDLAHGRAPLRRETLDDGARDHDLTRLGLAGHAIGGVYGRA